MARVTIEVTRDDIKKGVKGECDSCPVALALTRFFGSSWVAGPTTLWNATFEDQWESELDRRARLVTPCEVDEFMRRFDFGLYVEPFAFSLEVPDVLLPLKA